MKSDSAFRRSFRVSVLVTPMVLSAGVGMAQEALDPDLMVELPELYVSSSHTATVEPAGTYGAPVSRLELNPQFDLQVRNIAEAQGDVSIRGGIFEGTGFRVGAATLVDPQTGHYFAEIPIAPEMLRGPGLLVGADNAFAGFNSTVGTVDYSWSALEEGGNAAAGFGDNSLNYQRFHQAKILDDDGDRRWGVEWEASRSESAGTVENGDHNFVRYNARVQRSDENSQTDLFAGYQSKYLAWPELYAAPYGAPESDSVRTTLLMVNHRQDRGDEGFWEASAYFRRNHDHYLFNRFTDSLAFLHETEVSAAALNGAQRVSERLVFNFFGQVSSDSIESTTLANNFTSRDYLKVAVLPEWSLLDEGESQIKVRAGASYDDTNRDSSKLSPVADIIWEKGDDVYHLSYSQSSQVAGYTAVGGLSSGLFASNPDLRREVSRNLEAGVTLKRNDWSFSGVAFLREDGDLVDWTFSYASPSARSARNVDIDTAGLELIASRRVGGFELLGSLTVLDKDEDYGDASVDASYYALNFARLRMTAAVVWHLNQQLQLRIDNEYRKQQENQLRKSDDEALFTHMGVYYAVPGVEGLELNAAVENLWEDDFEEIPGTPGRGRQLSVGASWMW